MWTALLFRTSASVKSGVPVFVKITNTRKRDPVREYVKEYACKTSGSHQSQCPRGLSVQRSRSTGRLRTPPDSLYTLPTAPSAANPYSYTVANANYPFPLTVHRPQFDFIAKQTVKEAHVLQFAVNARTPATGSCSYLRQPAPRGASFAPATRTLSWTPRYGQAGTCCRIHRRRRRHPQPQNVSITVTPGVAGESTRTAPSTVWMCLRPSIIGRRRVNPDSCRPRT